MTRDTELGGDANSRTSPSSGFAAVPENDVFGDAGDSDGHGGGTPAVQAQGPAPARATQVQVLPAAPGDQAKAKQKRADTMKQLLAIASGTSDGAPQASRSGGNEAGEGSLPTLAESDEH